MGWIGKTKGVAWGLLLLALVAVACSPGYRPATGGANRPVSQSGTEPGWSRTSTEGNVTISVELQGQPSPGATGLSFYVVMDTHSVDLDEYDLARLAVLRDSRGREFRAASWDAPKGGHHRSGLLTFTSPQPLVEADTRFVGLVIRDVAGVSQRILTWELRQ